MAYGYYRSETVQASQVTGTLTDFPALFSRTHNDFRTVGNGGNVQNANGYDLNLFADSAGAPGTMLDMETEPGTYNAATGAVCKWARVPSIAVGTVVWWQYGDSGITTSQDNKTGVWNSGYLGVYHFAEASGNFSDSTSYGKTLTASSISAYAQAGRIGGASAATFSTSSTAYRTSDNEFNNLLGTSGNAVDLEIVIKFPTGFTVGRVVSKGNEAANSSQFQYLPQSIMRSVGSAGRHHSTTSTLPTTNTWATIGSGYTNGATAPQIVVEGSNAALTLGDGSASTYGCIPVANTFAVNGLADGSAKGSFVIDELRLSYVLRSTAWHAANYNNQSAPTSFWGLGSEQTVGSDAGLSSFRRFRDSGQAANLRRRGRAFPSIPELPPLKGQAA